MLETSRADVQRMLRALLAVLLLFAGTPLWAQPATGKASPEETCKACHAPYVEAYAASKHGTKADGRAPANSGGCLACHGDAALEHAAKGGGKGVGVLAFGDRKVAADRKSAVCLTCHQGGARTHWQMNMHASRDVACSSCHDIHTQFDRVRDKETQTQVCFTCHQEVRAQINRPSRHPIKEGKIACSDCHNAHGGAGEKQLVRDSVNDTCYSCHMEKRGPFVRTHQPVQENCSICHNPHGTTNPSLLKIRQPFLCQSCHEPSSHRGTIPNAAPVTGPVTLAGGLAPNPGLSQGVVMARGCLNCHTHIHGTNNPVDLAGERSFRR